VRSHEKQQFANEVGKRLKEAYKNSGLKSYKELADRIDSLGWEVSADSIPKYFPGAKEKDAENTMHIPGAYVLAALCEALSVSIDYILTGRDMYDDVLKKVFESDSGKTDGK